ncbi:MAG: S-layer protein, partial [Candidatus Nanosalina sp.]
SILPSKPGFVFIEEEDDTDVQESYTISASWSSSDDRLEMDTPSFSDTSKRTTKQMESDDDLKTGYDVWGTHTIYDSDEQGSFTLHYPNGQATAGAAFTGSNGGLSSSGGSGSVEVTTPTGFPDAARLDSDVSGTPSTNTILVGGPAVNTLVSDLAEAGKTWSGSDYSQGQALIQLVENAWNQNDALVVAGYSGSDTREAANFISNYADHQDRLSGKSKVTLSTGQ